MYGYKISRHLIWRGNICAILFVIISFIIIHLPSPSFWHHQKAFNQIFGFMPRVTIAGLLGNTLGLFLNTYLVSILKLRLDGKHYWFRSLLSTIIGELTYSFVSATIMYIGWMSFSKIIDLILSVFAFKVIYSVIANPFECIFAKMLKRKEGVDIYDSNTDFTPFKFGLDLHKSNRPNLKIVTTNSQN